VAESRKKVSQLVNEGILTHKDYQLICNISAKIAIKLQGFIDKFDAEKYSRDLLNFKEKDFAGMFLLFRTDYNRSNSFNPTSINQKMLQDLSPTPLLHNSYATFISNRIQKKQFVSQNRLSEVLKLLTKGGLFSHLKSKKEINKIIGCRKSSLKGRPSLYLVSNRTLELKRLFSKPSAVSMVTSSLNDSCLLSIFFRCVIAGFFQFVKDSSEKQLHDCLRSVRDESSEQISTIVQTYTNCKAKLSSLSRRQMNKLVKESTNEFMKSMLNDEQKFLRHILVILGQIK
jgi:hypothetical protein